VLNYAPSRAFDLISEASWFNDEPIGSFSTVAHFLLMQYATDRKITVLLSGQGADELLSVIKNIWASISGALQVGRFLDAARVLSGFLRRGTLLPGSIIRRQTLSPIWLRMNEDDIRGTALRNRAAELRLG
jgi:hypothetical protein